MKLLLLVLTSLIALTALQTDIAAQKIERVTFDSGKRDRSCYIFVPEKADAATPLPLLVLLHGSGNNGMSLADRWKDLAKTERFILAAPNSMSRDSWEVPFDGPDFIRDTVDFVSAKYPVDKRRVYLFGHSAGAIMALNLSLFESEYFAGAIAHAGALPAQMASQVRQAKRKIPIGIIVGTNDDFFPLSVVRATRNVLARAGFKVELTEIKGHTHDYYGIHKMVNDQAWAFLKEQKLPDDPVYESYNFK